MKPQIRSAESRILKMNVPPVADELVDSIVNLATTVEKTKVPGGKQDRWEGLRCIESGRSGSAERSCGFKFRP